MVINNNKILYLLCQLIRPLIYIVYNTTYKLYINSGDVNNAYFGGRELVYKTKYPFLSWTGTLSPFYMQPIPCLKTHQLAERTILRSLKRVHFH